MNNENINKLADLFFLKTTAKKKKKKKNIPKNKKLWEKAKSLAKSKFDVYPSIYANAWAAKWYKSKGGEWKKGYAADDGLAADDYHTNDQPRGLYQDNNEVFENDKGKLESHGKVYSDSGLGRWFAEEWVNIGKKEKGKHPPCGRDDADEGGYPKCVPKSKAKKMSKKQKESATRRKRKVERSKKRKDKKPHFVSTKKAGQETIVKEHKNAEKSYMSKRNLESIHRYSRKLMEMLNEKDDMPDQCDDKLSVAKSLLSDVYNYIANEKNIR